MVCQVLQFLKVGVVGYRRVEHLLLFVGVLLE